MKRFNWALLVLPVFMLMAYLPDSILLNPISTRSYSLVGALGFSVIVFSFLCAVGKSSSEGKGKRIWWERILWGVGIIALCALFVTSVALLSPATIFFLNDHNVPIEEMVARQHKLNQIILVHFVTLAYVIFCSISIWSRGVVGPEEAIIMNGRIYYSGERYFKNPFFINSFSAIRRKMTVSSLKIELNFPKLENTFNFVGNISIRISIHMARKSDVRRINYVDFRNKIDQKVAQIIREMADQKTMEEFVSAVRSERILFNVSGFPILFEGCNAAILS